MDSPSKSILKNKIKDNKIKIIYELQKEIEKLYKKQEEEKKQELSSYLDTQHMSPITKNKINRKIRNGTITTIKELKDEIIKEKKLKQDLISYLEQTNKGPNTKIKIREKILNGEITRKSQIDSYDPLEGGSIGFGYGHYRDGYDEDYIYRRDLYG